jgi:hypothetical protein
MFTTTHELPRSDWQARLDELTRERADTPTVLEVDRDGALRTQERGLLLRSVSYDSRHDVFEVTVIRPTPGSEQTLEHLVERPARMLVDGPGGIIPRVVTVEGEDGGRTVVRLAPPAAFSG